MSDQTDRLRSAERRASQDIQTLPILSGEQSWVELAIYRLRATAHRMSSDCEWLYAETDRSGYGVWRDALGKALLAARRLESILEREHGEAGAPATLHAMRYAIAAPQREIIDALSWLLTLIPLGATEEMVLHDARSVRDAAVGMMAADSVTTSAAPPTAPGDAGPPVTDVVEASERPARVLVVDDEEGLRQILSRLLRRLGYDVIVASNGREALELAERDAPDLVITDLSMPEMDGHQLLDRLKGSTHTRHIPVIVVSGESDTERVVRCLEQGAEDHLTKPYNAVVLQTRVKTLLERKRLRDLELADLRRVAQLTAAAEAVERQSYDRHVLDGLLVRQDALGQLSRVFDRMVGGMRSREAQLEARLSQLRGEIEQASAVRAAAVPSLELTIPDERPFAPGQVFAHRYEIKRELGMGGMGVVYLARDLELGEDVAIKFVRRDVVGQDATFRDRLKSEIRLARQISHRNVVRAHDLGEWDGAHYITMEFIAGVTVADLIATRGRLSVESTIAIGIQLADALAAAHGLDIIHRDIKPQNLLVNEAGVLKVADFGLARPVQKSARLTLGGQVVGTPAYMAPEQLLGGHLDARTDLFSVGVVLYECLAGHAPYGTSAPGAVLARMLAEPPPSLRSIVSEVPPALAAIIERLLQREPANRLQSARDLGDQLERMASG